MKVKFVGDPNNPGEANNLPEEAEAYGVVFPRGKWVEVPEQTVRKFEGNSHFEVQGAKEDSGSETVSDLKDRIATVDDVEALYAELDKEARATGKAAIEARIAELEEVK